MADTQKYYYMRLKDDYFNSPDQIYLETLPNGYLFSNILLKLYLLSLHDNGRLMFRDRIPYSVEMIASVTRHTADTVKQALETFESLGLIEVLDTGAMYMNDIQNFIGKSSTEADRKREQRTRIEAEKTISTADGTEAETAGHFADICPDISRHREIYSQSHSYSQKEKQRMSAPSPAAATDLGLEEYARSNLAGVSNSTLKKLLDYRRMFLDDVIQHAIDEACAIGKRSVGYTCRILDRYADDGLKTIADVKADASRQLQLNALHWGKSNRPF